MNDSYIELNQVGIKKELTSMFPGYINILKVVLNPITNKRETSTVYNQTIFNSTLFTYLQDVERQMKSVMTNNFMDMDIRTSSVIHDELLVDLQDNAKYGIDQNRDDIMCKPEEMLMQYSVLILY